MAEEQNNLSRLKGADKIRKRAGVMLGSTDIRGVEQTLFEIISNSIDRYKAGYGNVIKITKHKSLAYSIEDFADGLPMDWNEKENAYNWELALRVLYAGGNYDTTIDNHNGQLGVNGLGLVSTCLSSEYMTVVSKRNDFIYEVNFEQGRPVDKSTKDFICEDGEELFSKELGERVLNKIKNTTGTTGTFIDYKPDLEVFSDIDVPIDWLNEKCKKQAIVNSGLTIIVKDENTDSETAHYYENGIRDYVNELSSKSITDSHYINNEGLGKDTEDSQEYKASFELAFKFDNEVNVMEYYHNSSELEYGGSTEKAIKNGFTYAINQYITKNSMYNKDEKKITFVDIQDSLICIINSYSSMTSYENQTKKAITNKFIQDFVTETIKEQLNIYFTENDLDAQKICGQILANKRSREKAERTRINVRKQLSGNIDITNRIKKFVDCRTKDNTQRELYIVEGDSALGSCKLSRNSEFQALMPIRGKILNCLKADYEKIFSSEIIVDLLKIIGCGIEIKSKHNKELNTFNLENLRYSKIILATDQDIDAYQIRTLILTMFYVLTPTLISEGKIFIAESPLFEITYDGKTEFAYNEAEKNKIVSEHKKCRIQRSKGLGENTAEMMSVTTMNPETRKLIKVTMEDFEGVDDMFNLLLGDNLEGRKQCIVDNFNKYLEVL